MLDDDAGDGSGGGDDDFITFSTVIYDRYQDVQGWIDVKHGLEPAR